MDRICILCSCRKEEGKLRVVLSLFSGSKSGHTCACFNRASHGLLCLRRRAHKEQARLAMSDARFVEDLRPRPSLVHGRPAVVIHADNAKQLGDRGGACRCSGQITVCAPQLCWFGYARGRGGLEPDRELWRVRIDGPGGQVTLPPAREWRVDAVLKLCVKGVWLTGKELEVIIGHATVRALIHHSLQSCFHYCFEFIRKSFSRDTVCGSVLVLNWHRFVPCSRWLWRICLWPGTRRPIGSQCH